MLPLTREDALEGRVREIGHAILAEARAAEKAQEAAHRWETKLLSWCMSSRELQAQIFRFIDVYPSLTTARDVVAHIREYFPEGAPLPREIKAGLGLARSSLLTAPLVKKLTDWLMARVSRFFIGAESIEQAMRELDVLAQRGLTASIDLLGERVASEREAEQYAGRYRALIEALGARGRDLASRNISIKLSSLDARFDPLDDAGSRERAARRLAPILEHAASHDVFVFVDMEQVALRDLTLQIVQDILRDRPKLAAHMGIVLQAYLTDARETASSVLAWARRLSCPLTVRLVRGAYWDTEIMKAQEMGWPIPVWREKQSTDLAYEDLTRLFLAEHRVIRLAVATHNVRSIALAMAEAERLAIAGRDLEFQLLYGLGAPLEHAILAQGYPLRLYMPVGEPVAGMAYLVRRLLENVSQQSFLRRGLREERSGEDLLAPPAPRPARPHPVPGEDASGLAFANEPLLDFSQEATRQDLEAAIARTRRSMPKKIPLWIGSKETGADESAFSVNPARPGERVCEFPNAGPEEARRAVEAADRAQAAWARTPVGERAKLLRGAADHLRAKRMEVAALEILEVGKPWREADADVTEAIDYLEYYAACAERMFRERPTQELPHESNVCVPRPRGVTAVIAPWNFPLAILAGMSAGALAAGNAVVLKPAEQSPAVGWALLTAYRQAGFPEGVVNFLTGEGRRVGPTLVSDPRVAVIAFTGSREVGLEITALACAQARGQTHLKKVITEMGGKNAILVDASADPDEAIPAVLESAFGYAGQKCSAASRLIVVERTAAAFLERLLSAAPTMVVGDPARPETRVGPLIDASALARLIDALRLAGRTGKILYAAGGAPREGYFFPPAIVSDLPADSPLLADELFGPLLAVTVARDFEHALAAARASEYALTGGLFSRTPSHIAHARQEFDVGNLYINRKITGAVVRRQPFGGFRLSGGGSKAGGEDYLREFALLRTISESTMRHGYAPLILT